MIKEFEKESSSIMLEVMLFQLSSYISSDQIQDIQTLDKVILLKILLLLTYIQ